MLLNKVTLKNKEKIESTPHEPLLFTDSGGGGASGKQNDIEPSTEPQVGITIRYTHACIHKWAQDFMNNAGSSEEKGFSNEKHKMAT